VPGNGDRLALFDLVEETGKVGLGLVYADFTLFRGHSGLPLV
jgi:hypothetical protein